MGELFQIIEDAPKALGLPYEVGRDLQIIMLLILQGAYAEGQLSVIEPRH